MVIIGQSLFPDGPLSGNNMESGRHAMDRRTVCFHGRFMAMQDRDADAFYLPHGDQAREKRESIELKAK